jgi:class 3 adenylate cyclase
MVQEIPPQSTTSRASSRVAGERRIITVLFCDVAGSTALAEQFDREDWADIMNEAFGYFNDPVYRYGGTVARLMGDGILAFFGAPFAHEDDPERAVLAGLAIVDEMQPFRDQILREYSLDFNVRVGINTGPVVVGDVGSAQAGEYTAMGDAVNMAARMEHTAQPGTVQIGSDTYRLVAPLFDFEPLGGIEVKGKSAPVPAYRAIRPKEHPGSLRGIEGLHSPLIGRDEEFQKLRQAIEEVREGRGQIVFLTGDAGLGKSRLIEELRVEWDQIKGDESSLGHGSWTVSRGLSYESGRRRSGQKQANRGTQGRMGPDQR